jgi:hypothetical protein
MAREPHDLQRRLALCHANAEGIAYETDEIYARLLLIELATEFRVMAAHLEREAKRRTADRIRQQVDALRRRYG